MPFCMQSKVVSEVSTGSCRTCFSKTPDYKRIDYNAIVTLKLRAQLSSDTQCHDVSVHNVKMTCAIRTGLLPVSPNPFLVVINPTRVVGKATMELFVKYYWWYLTLSLCPPHLLQWNPNIRWDWICPTLKLNDATSSLMRSSWTSIFEYKITNTLILIPTCS